MLDSASVQELTSCAVGWISLMLESRLRDLAPNLVGMLKIYPYHCVTRRERI